MRQARSLFCTLLLAPGLSMASSFAGPDQHTCGTATVLEADPLNTGESGFWTVLQGNAFFTDANSPSSGVTQLAFGENVLMWTIISPSGSSTDLVSIWAYDGTMPAANAGPDQTVSSWPGTVQMSGSTPIAPGACFWLVVSGTCTISDPTNPFATVSSPAGTSILEWSCDNGPCGNSSDFVQLDVVVGMAEMDGGHVPMRYDPVGHRLLFGQQGTALAITLFDQHGRVVQQLTTPAGAGVWDLSAMPSGIYLAQVRTPEDVFVQRFAVVD